MCATQNDTEKVTTDDKKGLEVVSSFMQASATWMPTLKSRADKYAQQLGEQTESICETDKLHEVSVVCAKWSAEMLDAEVDPIVAALENATGLEGKLLEREDQVAAQIREVIEKTARGIISALVDSGDLWHPASPKLVNLLQKLRPWVRQGMLVQGMPVKDEAGCSYERAAELLDGFHKCLSYTLKKEEIGDHNPDKVLLDMKTIDKFLADKISFDCKTEEAGLKWGGLLGVAPAMAHINNLALGAATMAKEFYQERLKDQSNSKYHLTMVMHGKMDGGSWKKDLAEGTTFEAALAAAEESLLGKEWPARYLSDEVERLSSLVRSYSGVFTKIRQLAQDASKPDFLIAAEDNLKVAKATLIESLAFGTWAQFKTNPVKVKNWAKKLQGDLADEEVATRVMACVREWVVKQAGPKRM